MSQQLKGLFTALCPACRERGPVLKGNAFEWECAHRQATVIETETRRFLTLGKESLALSRPDDSDAASYVITN